MASRSAKALEIVARARRIWPNRVEQTGNGIWMIHCPDNYTVQVHQTPSDVNHHAVVMRQLNNHGFAEAEQDYLDAEQAERARKLAADREKTAALTKKIVERTQRHQAAIVKAAGPLAPPPEVTADEILAEHKEPHIYEYVLITPEMAKRFLERNEPTENDPWKNRHVSLGEVVDWAALMRAGRFLYTHQGVAFDWNGRLQDAQKRLKGIVDSGLAQRMMVSVGMDPKNFAVIDTGKRRTAAQILYMDGASSAGNASAVVKLLYIYGLWRANAIDHQRDKVPNDLIHEEYTKILKDSAGTFTTAMDKAKQLRRQIGAPVAGTAAAFYAILHRLPDDDVRAREFIDGLVRGVEPDETNPLYVLRRLLTRQAAGIGRKMVAIEHMGVILKTWALWAQGLTVNNSVGWRSDSRMPHVFLPPPVGEATAVDTEELLDEGRDDELSDGMSVTFADGAPSSAE